MSLQSGASVAEEVGAATDVTCARGNERGTPPLDSKTKACCSTMMVPHLLRTRGGACCSVAVARGWYSTEPPPPPEGEVGETVVRPSAGD